MSAFQSIFIPAVAGLLLLTIGFSYRESNYGVLMIWLGMIGMMGLMVFKILEKLT